MQQTIKTMYLLEKKKIQQIAEELKVTEDYVRKTLGKLVEKDMSAGEKAIYIILKELYPFHVVQQEVSIENLFLDTYIPKLRLAIEIDGQQHFDQVDFFHGKRTAGQYQFEYQLENDRKKESLAKKKNIYLIRIPYTTKLTTDNVRRIISEHYPNIIANLSDYSTKIGLE